MKDLEKEYPILKKDRQHRMQQHNERRGNLKWISVIANIILKVIFSHKKSARHLGVYGVFYVPQTLWSLALYFFTIKILFNATH